MTEVDNARIVAKMTNLAPIAFFTAILIAATANNSSAVASTERSVKWKSYHFPSQQIHHIVFEDESYDNSSLVYAICDDQQVADYVGAPRNCQVILEDGRDDDGSSALFSSSCNVTLLTEETNDVREIDVPSSMNLILLEGRRALLIWCRDVGPTTCHPAFHLIGFPGCDVVETRTFAPTYGSMPLEVSVVDRRRLGRYEAYFETRLTSGLSRLIVDAKSGEILSGPRHWTSVSTDKRGAQRLVASLQHDRDDSDADIIGGKGIDDTFLLAENFETLSCRRYAKNRNRSDRFLCGNVSLVSGDGVQNRLRTYSVERLLHYDLVHSTAHDRIGVCSSTLWRRANCAQYDRNGNLLLETNATIQTRDSLYDPVMLLAMLNLRDGGFLLMVDECPENIFECRQRILKIGKDGRIEGYAIVMSRYKYDELMHIRLKAKLFVNPRAAASSAADDRYCAAMIYQPGKKEVAHASGDSTRFGFANVCFDPEDFTVSEIVE